MEGIEQNPVVYDLMSEMAFQHNKVDVKVRFSHFLILFNFRIQTLLIVNIICSFLLFQGWINQYSTRRYGRSVPLVQDAWSILHHTIYNCTDGAYVSGLNSFSVE